VTGHQAKTAHCDKFHFTADLQNTIFCNIILGLGW
jgi:hypothetical protein